MVVRTFGGLGSTEAVSYWMRLLGSSAGVFYTVYASTGFLGYVAFSSAHRVHGDIFLNFEVERANGSASAIGTGVTAALTGAQSPDSDSTSISAFSSTSTVTPYTAMFAVSFWSALFRVVFVCVNLLSCVVVVEPCRQSLASLLGLNASISVVWLAIKSRQRLLIVSLLVDCYYKIINKLVTHTWNTIVLVAFRNMWTMSTIPDATHIPVKRTRCLFARVLFTR